MMVSVAELAFHRRLGCLVESLPSAQFWSVLVGFLQDCVAFDAWIVVTLGHGRAPLVLAAHGYETSELELSRHVESLSSLSPQLRVAQGATQRGVFRLETAQSDDQDPPEHRGRSPSRPVAVDELQFLTPFANGGSLSLSLRRKERFSDLEVGQLFLYSPWLLPLMCEAAAHAAREAAAAFSPPRPHALRLSFEDWLRIKADPPLTERELQTTLLMLAGHSAKGVASRMGISAETVKIHKRNIYKKLGISNQSGLFAQYLSHAPGPPNASALREACGETVAFRPVAGVG